MVARRKPSWLEIKWGPVDCIYCVNQIIAITIEEEVHIISSYGELLLTCNNRKTLESVYKALLNGVAGIGTFFPGTPIVILEEGDSYKPDYIGPLRIGG